MHLLTGTVTLPVQELRMCDKAQGRRAGHPRRLQECYFQQGAEGYEEGEGHGPWALYLVKSLVDSYGGTVWVEDRVPGDHTKGARIVVMLPVVNE